MLPVRVQRGDILVTRGRFLVAWQSLDGAMMGFPALDREEVTRHRSDADLAHPLLSGPVRVCFVRRITRLAEHVGSLSAADLHILAHAVHREAEARRIEASGPSMKHWLAYA